eukprot:15459494-Alexandrium_andersonii.AAC.1
MQAKAVAAVASRGSAGARAEQWNVFVASCVPYPAQIASPAAPQEAALRAIHRTICRGWGRVPQRLPPSGLGLRFGI